jgi:hypothetical protein
MKYITKYSEELMEKLHKKGVVWSWGHSITEPPLGGWDLRKEDVYLEIVDKHFNGLDNSFDKTPYKRLLYMSEETAKELVLKFECKIVDNYTFLKANGLEEEKI